VPETLAVGGRAAHPSRKGAWGWCVLLLHHRTRDVGAGSGMEQPGAEAYSGGTQPRQRGHPQCVPCAPGDRSAQPPRTASCTPTQLQTPTGTPVGPDLTSRPQPCPACCLRRGFASIINPTRGSAEAQVGERVHPPQTPHSHSIPRRQLGRERGQRWGGGS